MVSQVKYLQAAADDGQDTDEDIPPVKRAKTGSLHHTGKLVISKWIG